MARSTHKPAKEWGSKGRKVDGKRLRAADQALAIEEGLELVAEGLQLEEVQVTLWADPQDCGLRLEPGAWRSPRDAHAAGFAAFSRLSRSQERLVAEWLQATDQDDPTSWSPGEWAVVTLPDAFVQGRLG